MKHSFSRVATGLCLVLLLSSPVAAQDLDYDLDAALLLVQSLKQPCGTDDLSFDCELAKGRAVAIVANVVAEAGNSRDRGTFIDLVRALLADEHPEIRTAAAYALAKLGPDAADTPVLRGMMRDPISNVRAGAWAAASVSSDPVAKAMAERIPERPAGRGYGPDPDPFDPGKLTFDLPPDAQFLWLAVASRDVGQLHFLTSQPIDQTVAHFAKLAGGVTIRLDSMSPELLPLLAEFSNPRLFHDVEVVTLGQATAAPPSAFAVIYHDVAFDQTGFAIVFADGGSLAPPPTEEPELALSLDEEFDPAVFDETMLQASGLKPDAPGEESDLFLAVVAAHGYGADLYLDLYPEGAYAAEARAIMAGPRLILDDVSYSDTDIITASFANVPVGASADLSILNVSDGYATEANQYVFDFATTAKFENEGRLTPGVYLMQADVRFLDGSDPITLRRDFSITAGLAELATDKTDFAPGEAINVRFAGMSGDDEDYVSVAIAGSVNGSAWSYVYTGGRREGSVTLLAPTTPGAYELRAFFREDESVLRASMPITVGGSAPVQEVVTPAEESVEEAAIVPQEVVVPPTGEPSPDARATLALDKTTYAPGEAIVVTYAGMFGDQYDYISIAIAGSANAFSWTYIYTGGLREGSVTLTAPTAPGAYEVRAFFREDEAILRGSVAFEIR